MEIFNNRELVIALWVVAISFYVLKSPKMKDVRKSFKRVIEAFFVKTIMSVLSLMIIYMGTIVYMLSEMGLWNVEQVKNTLFWGASVGLMSLFKLETIKTDENFFKHSVVGNLKLLALIQFVVSVYSFPLLGEVVLVPLLAFIGAMLAIAGTDEKYVAVKRLLEYLLSTFGLLVIGYTIYMLITNFGEIAKEKTLYDFIVPPLLTLFYLPFIFIMMVYSTYEQVSVRLRYSIKSNWLRYTALTCAFLLFNCRTRLLERWSSHVAKNNINSCGDMFKTFAHIHKVRRAEKHPLDISPEDGWSPYEAKEYLSNKGLKTGFYNNQYGNEWVALSPMHELGDGLIPDNIAYYVEGSQDVAITLKLKLNINDKSREVIALNELSEMAELLCQSSLKLPLSENMKNAIMCAEQLVEVYGNKQVSLIRDEWPDHVFSGYDVKFVVSSI
ncbi:hypothetical protein [Photobacterium sanguinicancri]|uniref:hypothetical protein n=1 Tax=Photobacterium sanguinicancri TaxID=875932 RepID=UPI0026E3858C|nr:hypothetical protein [Photobacterium sanguinicancri]MDO6501216.1 hypothetical protein [Photobacterium sanguinicancri]